MDTTAMKSWYEVVKWTDPVIWSLALEGTSLAAAAVETDVELPSLHRQLHLQVALQPNQPYYQQYEQHQQHQQTLSITSPASQEHISVCCKSLLDPLPQNALEWLKCLIQTTNNEVSTGHRLKRRDLWGPLDTQANFELAGEGLSSRGLYHCAQGVGGDSASATWLDKPANITSSGSRHHHLIEARAAFGVIASKKNHGRRGGVISLAASSSTTLHASTPASDSIGYSPVVAAGACIDSETESANPFATEQTTETAAAGPNLPPSKMQSLVPSSGQRNAGLPPIESSAAVVTDSSSSGSDTTVSASVTSHAHDTAIPVSNGKIPRIATLLSNQVLCKAVVIVQEGLLRSKVATTGFLYRTFSPTYRVSRLYLESWNNGSQRRGLERIRNSVLRGDAFSLVHGATDHMRNVWNQVIAAYRTKSIAASSGSEKSSRVMSRIKGIDPGLKADDNKRDNSSNSNKNNK